MPDFNYWAMTEIGDAVTGQLTASSPDAAAHLLTLRGLTVQRLEEIAKAPVEAKEPTTLTEADFGPMAPNLETAPAEKRPLITSLRVLAEESRSLKFRGAVRRVISDLEAGRPLASVLTNLPSAFPRRIKSLVNAGVSKGQLPHLMQHALDHLRRSAELRRKIWWNLSYPLVLLVFAGGILGGILLWIVPNFKKIFDDFGTQLPGLTMAIVAVSDLCVHVVFGFVHFLAALGWTWSPLLLLGGLSLLVAAGYVIGEFEWGRGVRRVWQQCVSWVPLLGPVYRAVSLSGFFRLLAMLVEAGFSLPAALRLAADVNHDEVLAAGVKQISADLEQGVSAVDAVRVSEAFPREVLPIFRWADNRPLFIEALRGASEIYASRSQMHSGITLVVLEPTMIFGVGMTVGLVVLALFLPLIKLLNDLA